MKQSQVTVTGAGVSAPVPVNTNVTPVNIGIGCVVSAAATVSYGVEYTFDKIFADGFNPATATWFPSADLAAETTNQYALCAIPVTAFRLNVTASDGTVTMKYVQAGI